MILPQRIVSFNCHSAGICMHDWWKKGQIPWRMSHDLNSESKIYKVKRSIHIHAWVSCLTNKSWRIVLLLITRDFYCWKFNSISPKVIPKRYLMLTLCRNCEWILNLNGIKTSFKKFAQQMLLAKISREFKNSRISKKLFCLKGGCYLPLISYP